MTDTSEHYDSIDIHIRWSDRQDLIIRGSPTDKVITLKEKIKQSSNNLENKRLRLIYNGRVLEDQQTLLDYDIGKILLKDSKAKIPPPPPIFIHCSISEYNTQGSTNNDQPQMTPPVGFDRLREAGFSEEDIRNIRTQFHRMNGAPVDGDGNNAYMYTYK
ncbi:hypothetical protein BJ944DRAFT_1374 [Cunninghamella echinulata]|nr:hypothetical protein BJ944DRAFT_1374 [Cunninghamella echinulata]